MTISGMPLRDNQASNNMTRQHSVALWGIQWVAVLPVRSNNGMIVNTRTCQYMLWIRGLRSFIVCKIELWQEGFRLCFQVKDNHFCPILNENIIIVTAHGSNILKHMDTIKWSDQHNQKTIVKCLKMEDYWTAIESEDKIWIVLPRGTDMKKVLVMTMKKMRVHTSSIQRSMSSNTCKRPINIESGSKATGRDL